MFVPSLDEDGNLKAGVMVPEAAAPLSTMGKAIRAAGFAVGDLCGVNGSTIAFPRTKEERMALGDSRLSLEERYPGGEAEYAKRGRSSRSARISSIWPRAERRSSAICRARTCGSGRSVESSTLSSRSQKRSRLTLSRPMTSSYE